MSRWRKWLELAIEPLERWSSDRCSTMSAAIAFYSAFSLAPALLIVIAVASVFYGADAIQGKLFEDIRGVVGDSAAAGLQAMVANARSARSTTQTTLLSLAGIMIGATAAFSSLNTALNEIWPTSANGMRANLIGLVRVRMIAFALTVGVGVLMILLLIIDAVVSGIGALIWGPQLPEFFVANVMQHVGTLIVLCLAFSALLKFLPNAPVRWDDAAIGGTAAALLFTGGKHLFALYLAHAGTANAFGAAGSLAVVLLWLYFSAAVFLLGAEIAASSGRHRADARASVQRLP